MPPPQVNLNFYEHARILFRLTAIAWLVHAINFRLSKYERPWLNLLFGLRPRNLWGLVCIFTCPFLHGNNKHIAGNTLAFLPLGWYILLQGINLFYVVTIAIVIFSGLTLWLLGETGAKYVGASCVTFGYRGFLLLYGLTSGSLIAVLLALFVCNRQLWKITGNKHTPSSMLPGSKGAWLGHFSGFVAGALTALILSDMRLRHL